MTYRYRNKLRWSLRPSFAFQGLSTRSSPPVTQRSDRETIEMSNLISFSAIIVARSTRWRENMRTTDIVP
jgi:hypothetical protein